MKIKHFKNIIGNSTQLRLLRRSADSSKLPHGLVFSGPKGVGKGTSAGALAAYLFCENRSEDDYCGECRNCKLMISGNHPDFYFIGLEDGKSEIGIDRIRELNAKFYKKPYIASSKVALIDGADILTMEASNSLLKVLEEPPGNSFLILVTSAYESLLPTIKSRTQHFRFGPLGREELHTFLEKHHTDRFEDFEFLSHIALGSPGEALEYDESARETMENLIAIFEKLLIDKDPTAGLDLSQQLQVKRDLFDRLIKYCYYILRDIQCLAWDRESEQIINMKKRKTLLLMADNIDKIRLNELLGRFDRWSGASKKYLNLKLNAEDFTLRVQSLSL